MRNSRILKLFIILSAIFLIASDLLDESHLISNCYDFPARDFGKCRNYCIDEI